MLAEIIAIGDELTSGQRLDTNSRWLSSQLSDLGITTVCHQTIADYLLPMMDAFRLAASRADVICVTGGLGPTADDLTRQALAGAFGAELTFDSQSWLHIESLFRRRNFPMPESNRIQAMFPQGSLPIPNATGTAPGIDWQVTAAQVTAAQVAAANRESPGLMIDGMPQAANANSVHRAPRKTKLESRFFCLPGVPAEMNDMFRETVVPRLGLWQGAQRTVICRQVVHTFGAGESQVESLLPDLIRRGNDPQVGITASKGTISLRIEAKGNSQLQCAAKIRPVVETIEQTLGTLIFGQGDENLEDAVTQLLLAEQENLVVVEWGTSGQVSQWLSDANQRSPQRLASSPGQTRSGQTRSGQSGPAMGAAPAANAADSAQRFAAGFQGSVILNGDVAVAKWLAPDASFSLDPAKANAVGPVPPPNYQAVVRDLADVAARRFQSSLTIASGPLPNSHHAVAEDAPFPFQIVAIRQRDSHIARFSRSFSVLGHTSIWLPRAAKQVLNHLRLILLGELEADTSPNVVESAPLKINQPT